MIDKNSIEQLKNILDIVDVVSNYIELKKSGANYKALCPFHDEDTPSFVVSPNKQIYHCFGCQAGGDSIKFVMDYEKLSYPEAVEKLASMYNFTLNYTAKNDSFNNVSKALSTINELYKKKLLQNSFAQNYLIKRGVSKASIEKFEIGYAPKSHEQIDFLKARFIPIPNAIEAGILAKEQNLYARMVERITFPIYSHTNNLVGFGGRTITNHPAKYLNTPQTKLFNKSRLLYGYNLAKESIYKQKKVIICEGYLDVVMLHQAGFTNTVATLGTALTHQHMPLLRKAEPEVIIAYDGDKAGIEAAIKASKLLALNEVEGGVVIFKDSLDPADMVKEGKIEELNQLFSQPKPFIEFVLEQIVAKYDIKKPKEKQKALYEAVEFLKTLSSIFQDEYKEYLAALLEILPSKIPLKRKKEEFYQEIEVKDTKELSLIKTVIIYPETIDEILDIIDPSYFIYHRYEFQKAIEMDLEDSKVREIYLDDEIIPFDKEHLKDELISFLIKYYEKKLKKIIKEPMDTKEKYFLIRKYKENILKLKKGELVVS
jgi:DNA primase